MKYFKLFSISMEFFKKSHSDILDQQPQSNPIFQEELKLNITEKIIDNNNKIKNLIYNINDYSNGKFNLNNINKIKLTKRKKTKKINGNLIKIYNNRDSPLNGNISTKGETNFFDSISRFNNTYSNYPNVNINKSISFPKINNSRYFGKSDSNKISYYFKSFMSNKNKSSNLKTIIHNHKNYNSPKNNELNLFKKSVDDNSINKNEEIIKTYQKPKKSINIFRTELSKINEDSKKKTRNFFKNISSVKIRKFQINNFFNDCNKEISKAENLEVAFIEKINDNFEDIEKKFNDEKNINNIPYIEENEDDKKFMTEENKTLRKFIMNTRLDRKKILDNLDNVTKISDFLAFQNRKIYYKTFGNYTIGDDDDNFIFHNEIEGLKNKEINEFQNKKSHSSNKMTKLLEMNIQKKKLILKKYEIFHKKNK